MKKKTIPRPEDLQMLADAVSADIRLYHRNRLVNEARVEVSRLRLLGFRQEDFARELGNLIPTT